MIKLQLVDHNPHCGVSLTHYIVKASMNTPSPINFETHAVVKTNHEGKFISLESFDLSKIESNFGELIPEQFDGFLKSINTSVEEVEETMSSAFLKDMNWDLPSNQTKNHSKREINPLDGILEQIFGVKIPSTGSTNNTINDLLNTLRGI